VNGAGKGGTDIGREYKRVEFLWANRKHENIVTLAVGEE
jgi:hypothetical protein